MGSSRGTVTYLYEGILRIYVNIRTLSYTEEVLQQPLALLLVQISRPYRGIYQRVTKDCSHQNKSNYPKNANNLQLDFKKPCLGPTDQMIQRKRIVLMERSTSALTSLENICGVPLKLLAQTLHM